MTGERHGKSRVRQGRRAAATGAVAAMVAAVVFGSVSSALASAHERPAPAGTKISGMRPEATGPRSGGSVTPSGWAAVPYQRAQLSVPGMWLVESPQQLSCGLKSSGMIFVGARPGFPAGYGCRLTASLAWILPARHIPAGIAHQRPAKVIHGIPVYRLLSGKGSTVYLVPELRVRVGARGPLARRVLATLTWSPLAIVLRTRPAGRVPAGWTWHRFGGIRFAAPRSWNSQREDQWATCGTGQVPQSLLLIDATKPPASLPCPYQIPTAAADEAQPGLTVVTGKYAAKSVEEDFTHCHVRRGARICLSSITGQGGLYGGVLIFSVSRPNRSAATFFLLGLSGTGTNPRVVFDSISTGRR
jgi:hypothetical protein